MEFLKLKLVFGLLFMISLTIQAQSFDKQLIAFENSYRFEENGKYNEAVQEILNIYDENSYEHNLRLAWLHYVSGRFTESLPYYQKCITQKPLAIEARFGYINPAAALGNWTQVENQYQEILRIDPQNTLANYRMALLAYGREDYLTALRYLNKVVNLYPFDYDTVILQAWTELKLGKLREARIMFQKALLIRPGDSSASEGLILVK
ncbi:MAG: tetratricopeptide repeat protein [Bacteroidales bacterium]|jgi:tetratricopeptide (TPR) repeat protein|nr:tetratricopeptide repeat protein [Bacteroidales bacterium]HOI33303.1 tetratricopeptide repeat protein [Bacteroidales bacterium]